MPNLSCVFFLILFRQQRNNNMYVQNGIIKKRLKRWIEWRSSPTANKTQQGFIQNYIMYIILKHAK